MSVTFLSEFTARSRTSNPFCEAGQRARHACGKLCSMLSVGLFAWTLFAPLRSNFYGLSKPRTR